MELCEAVYFVQHVIYRASLDNMDTASILYVCEQFKNDFFEAGRSLL